MSAIQEVAELIDERGSGTVDDILPELEMTRKQAIKALQNARLYKLIACDGRAPRAGQTHLGSKPATYRTLKVEKYRPRISSVWDLAQVAA